MIEEIQEHFEKEYPREGCGVIGIVKGKKKWFPCTNTANTNENFVMSSLEYLDIKRRADIFAIVHSHPDATNEPSQHDIDCCNALGIPYYIFSYPEMKLNIIEPITKCYHQDAEKSFDIVVLFIKWANNVDSYVDYT